MATFHSNTQRRKDEPEDLRHLRQEHGASLVTLKELFADWTEEDLLYAIQDAGGDLELTILRISDGHATQWGEVKGKKKTPKAKTASEKQEFRSSNSQRGGFAGRGRGDSSRGGRGGATRGAPRALNGGDRNGRPTKTETEITAVSEQSQSEIPSAEKIESGETAAAESTADVAAGWGSAPAWGASATTNDSTTTSATADAWSTPATATTATTTNDSTPAAAPVAPVRKVNTATIPAGSKMSWAKIVKPAPAPQPVVPAPVAPSAPVNIPAPEPVVPEAEKIVEPVVETTPEVVAAVIEEKEPEAPAPEVVEEKIEEKIEEPVAAPEPVAEVEPAQAAPASPKAVTPVGPPGLKPKAVAPRRLNQDAPVVMPSGSSALQSVGVKFGSFSLNDDAETPEPEPETTQPAQPVQPEQPAATQPTTPSQQPQQQQQPAYGRQSNPPAGASGFQGVSPAAASGLSPAASNAAYLKQDPAANYLGQHHHHPGMGPEAMGSPYGSYMPNPANQLGSFGMPPMASLPNDYAALYGNDLQRAMYYDPATYGQVPVTATNNYQSRDSKFNQDASATTSTSGAAATGTTQAQQTLQQQQQQVYPNMAGGMPYYPYYYMGPSQFPNYQQSGYGQPFVNKNMYPMYQHQQQQHSSKPGAANSSSYGNYTSTAGQGHHQYSQAAYEDMSAGGIHGMGGLNNDPYAKYGNPGMQNFLGNQQQPATATSNANSAKGNSGNSNYTGADKNASASSQSTSNTQMAGGASSLQSQQPGNANQSQQGYYQQQMFSNYQYPSHHQGYHPNQHQGQHQGSGRNQQQFWSQN